MADNTQLDLGSGGDLISTDDIGAGVKVQRGAMSANGRAVSTLLDVDPRAETTAFT